MKQIASPTREVDQPDRLRECDFLCETIVADIIRLAVEAGWREKEFALCLADAADDYVVDLMTRQRH